MNPKFDQNCVQSVFKKNLCIINFYQKATSLNPHHDNAFYRLAAAQQQVGLKNAALQNCQKALQINPNNQYAKDLLVKLK